MYKSFLIVILLITSMTSVFAASPFKWNRLYQSRLNNFVQAVRLPAGEYKLTVSASGNTIVQYVEPTPKVEVQVKEVEKVVVETKTVEVPKYITVEKVLPDPRITPDTILFTPDQYSNFMKMCSGPSAYCSEAFIRGLGVRILNPGI